MSVRQRVCTIIEQGNGFPSAGDYCVHSQSGELYRVISTGSRIDTSRHPRGNSISGRVELADWSECAEGDEHTAALCFDVDQ